MECIDWEGVEEQLQESELVQGDYNLHLRAVVTMMN
jgi:hypothetical protein